MCERDRAVKKSGILIFGGTTEGRLLAEFCAAREIRVWVSVISDYGRELLPDSPFLRVSTGAMEKEEIRGFLERERIGLAVDATHPFAREATANLTAACRETGAEVLRCLRDAEIERGGEKARGENTGREHADQCACRRVDVSSPQEAVSYLEGRSGNILLVTGSKELEAFSALTDFTERVFARVLPSVEAVEACGRLGLRGRHLICMQGPFSAEMNTAMIREVGAEFLVTKQSGRAGGFDEKLRAAKACGITAVVIGRPAETVGADLEAVKTRLEQFAVSAGEAARPAARVILAGIGTGAREQMTEAVVRAIRESDRIFGAPRMLRAARAVLGEKATPLIGAYLPRDVVPRLKECGGTSLILFSGDTGFYSGAGRMADCLAENEILFTELPGISSVSYFAARLHVSWDHALFLTAHGRETYPEQIFTAKAGKIFLLLGGENGAGALCRALAERGMGDVRVTVGENLSYPEERITAGTAGELAGRTFAPLSAVLLMREEENEG